MKVELYIGKDGDWYFRTVATGNGAEITRSSEGYRDKRDALTAIALAHAEIPVVEVEVKS